MHNFNLTAPHWQSNCQTRNPFELECSPTSTNLTHTLFRIGLLCYVDMFWYNVLVLNCTFKGGQCLVRPSRYIGESIRLRKVLGFGLKCFSSLGFFPPAAGRRTPARP